MGQPARFTEEQLRELDTAAALIVEAIEDDEPNPVASPFFDRTNVATDPGEIRLALEDGLDTVAEELNKYAIAYQQARENERRTDAQLAKIEHELELRETRIVELENVIEDGGERSVDVILELRTAKARIAELEALIANGDRFAIEGARAALAGSKRAPMATPNRRAPVAGEVLPPEQRATWARGRSTFDHPNPRAEDAAALGVDEVDLP